MKKKELNVGDMVEFEGLEVEVMAIAARKATIASAEFGEQDVAFKELDALDDGRLAELAAIETGHAIEEQGPEGDEIEPEDAEELDEDAPADGTSMKEQMNKFRVDYVDSVSHTGNKSQNNGDGLAILLAGLSGIQVCHIAMSVCLECPNLIEKYITGRPSPLNEGQIRMNAGNRIRAALKLDEDKAKHITMEAVELAVTDHALANQEAAKQRAADAEAAKAEATDEEQVA